MRKVIFLFIFYYYVYLTFDRVLMYSPRIYVLDDDKTLVRRKYPNSELEVRILSAGRHDLQQDLFYSLKNGLAEFPGVTIEHQEYTNTSYDFYETIPDYNNPTQSIRRKSLISSYRQTQQKGKEDSWIQKIKTPYSERYRQFFKTYSFFNVKCAEAQEISVNPSEIDTSNRAAQRYIRRDKMSISYRGVRFQYDVSVVTMLPQKTDSFEIEFEIPNESDLDRFQMNLADYAIMGISILLDQLLAKQLHPSYFIPEMSLIESYTKRIQELTPYTKRRMPPNRSPFDLNVRNDPINLKEAELGNLDQYAMTNKLDGERKLIFYNEGSEFMILHPSGFRPNKWDSVYCIRTNDRFPVMLLDSEYFKSTFYLFDVIQFGKDIPQIEQDNAHEFRMMQVDQTILAKIKGKSMIPKKFYYLTLSENLNNFMKDNPADTFFRDNDGLIFTEKTKSYRDTKHFKYKFASKMSIDFQLYASPKPNEVGQIVYDLIVNRSVPNSSPVPIHFQQQRLVTYGEYNPQQTTFIMECVYHSEEKRWVALRERADKEFPNAERTALDVWQDIQHPIPFERLIDSVEDSPLKATYLQEIAYLDRQFLTQHFMDKRRYVSYAFDMNPPRTVHQICQFFGIYAPQYKTDINKVLYQGYKAMDNDNDIITQISRKASSFRIYGNDNEAGFLEKTIPPYLTTQNIFDSRVFQDTPLCKIGARQQPVSIHQVVHMSLKPTIQVLSKYSAAIIAENKEYERYTTVDLNKDGKIVEWSASQTTLPSVAKPVRDVFKKWIKSTDRVLDATAHIGIDSIIIASMSPRIKIDAMDIDPIAVEALVSNVRKFNLETQIRISLQDSAYFIYELSNENSYDVVYIDAPSGRSQTKLYLQSELEVQQDEDRSIQKVALYLLQHKITERVILKIPASYPLDEWKRLFEVESVAISVYRLVLLTAKKIEKIASESPVVVWSIPYVDDYERLFPLTLSQQHLFVRCPINMVAEQFSSLLFQYHLPNFTAHPLRITNQQQMDYYAQRHGYRVLHRFDIDPTYMYLHYFKNDGKVPISNPNPVIQCAPNRPEAPITGKRTSSVVQTLDSSNKAIKSSFISTPSTSTAPIIMSSGELKIQAVPPQAQGEMSEDTMKNTKKYHNEEKRKLIENYCKEKRVLDLGAGYGGDLHKYSNAQVSSLILVEPNKMNIESESNPEGLLSRIRYMLIKDRTHVIHTVGQDTETILQQEIIPYGRVNVVASFFSMTFLFESREILRGFLQTVQASLLEGGYFIGTMMEGEKTKNALKEISTGQRKKYGPVEIVKQYQDEQPDDTGMKLWINIENSIVINQDEYLAFFSVLREEAAKLDLVFEHKFDFHPDSYHGPIPDEEKAFSRLNIGFVFRKMPKSISTPLSMLPVDSSRECTNLFGEDQIMVRTGVEQDGSCFYHSYLFNFLAEYRQASRTKRTAMCDKFRLDFGNWVTFEKMIQILPFSAYHFISERLEDLLSEDEIKEYKKVIPDDFERFSEWYSLLNSRQKEVFDDVLINKWVRRMKRDIQNPSTWADQDHIALLMEWTQVNIYMIDSSTRRPVLLLFNSYKVSRTKSMVILAMNLTHFEPMGYMNRGVAKRIMKPFDTNLIYLHHTLMKYNESK